MLSGIRGNPLLGLLPEAPLYPYPQPGTRLVMPRNPGSASTGVPGQHIDTVLPDGIKAARQRGECA